MATFSDPPSATPLSGPVERAGLPGRSHSLRAALHRLIARPGFQAWAARMPFAARQARRDGEEIFDLVAGFVNAQVLQALVALGVFEALLERPLRPDALAEHHGIAPERMQALLQAGVALGLLRTHRDGRIGLARKGAAVIGVPGLQAMIQHHGAFYRDMADPVALLRGETETELAAFWPYVFGADGAKDPEVTATYSTLMAESQALVAADTLRMVSFKGVKTLMDVGGGSGAFALAVAKAHRGPQIRVFDLPGVARHAETRFDEAGLSERLHISEGSFRDAALPEGADAISLIRVLYDHEDDTVCDLLRKCHAALPPGGRLIISEPMTGGTRPHRAGDVYFAFYCMAMQTGQARAPERIADLCREAGFAEVRRPKSPRPFVTSAILARKAAR